MEEPSWPIEVTDEELYEWLKKLQGPGGNDPGDLATLYIIAIGAPAIPHLTPLLTSSTPKLRSRILNIFGAMGQEGKAATPSVQQFLSSSAPRLVAEASGVLLRISPPQPKALENLLDALDSDELDLQREAAFSLLWCIQLAYDDPDDPTRQCDETMQWLWSLGEYLAERCMKLLHVDDDGEGIGRRFYQFLGPKAQNVVDTLIAEYHHNRNPDVLDAIIATEADVTSFLAELRNSSDPRDQHNVALVLGES